MLTEQELARREAQTNKAWQQAVDEWMENRKECERQVVEACVLLGALGMREAALVLSVAGMKMCNAADEVSLAKASEKKGGEADE